VGSERLSSPRTQIAKQNRIAGAREAQEVGLCFTQPTDEDAIWQREMCLKVVAGGVGVPHTIRHVFMIYSNSYLLPSSHA